MSEMDPSRWRLALRSLGKPLVLGVEGWVYGCRMISYRARCQHGALGACTAAKGRWQIVQLSKLPNGGQAMLATLLSLHSVSILQNTSSSR